MKMLKIISLIVWLTLHPVHVTFFGIEYSESSKTFFATLKVFYDDFLLDYENLKGTMPGFDFRKNRADSEKHLREYLSEKIVFRSENKTLGFSIDKTYLNTDDNELIINLSYKYSGPGKSFSVKNSMLTGVHKDQSNFVILRIREFEEGVKLTPEKDEHVFNTGAGK